TKHSNAVIDWCLLPGPFYSPVSRRLGADPDSVSEPHLIRQTGSTMPRTFRKCLVGSGRWWIAHAPGVITSGYTPESSSRDGGKFSWRKALSHMVSGNVPF
ncbi:hypothetical protein AVEN_20058-1, partial [Araneus ventricosus]